MKINNNLIQVLRKVKVLNFQRLMSNNLLKSQLRLKDINNILFFDFELRLLKGQICHSFSPSFGFLFKLQQNSRTCFVESVFFILILVLNFFFSNFFERYYTSLSGKSDLKPFSIFLFLSMINVSLTGFFSIFIFDSDPVIIIN